MSLVEFSLETGSPGSRIFVEVDFGFKLSAEGSFVLVKGSGEANFSVKLTWKKPEAK